jgi:hypothetical protein
MQLANSLTHDGVEHNSKPQAAAFFSGFQHDESEEWTDRAIYARCWKLLFTLAALPVINASRHGCSSTTLRKHKALIRAT